MNPTESTEWPAINIPQPITTPVARLSPAILAECAAVKARLAAEADDDDQPDPDRLPECDDCHREFEDADLEQFNGHRFCPRCMTWARQDWEAEDKVKERQLET